LLALPLSPGRKNQEKPNIFKNAGLGLELGGAIESLSKEA
jgi:hypothetical protein